MSARLNCFVLLLVAAANGQRTAPPPARTPAPATRAESAPQPVTTLKIFQPGNFPPAHVLDTPANTPIPAAPSLAESSALFNVSLNPPFARLSFAHLEEPNRADLRLLNPTVVGAEVIGFPDPSVPGYHCLCLNLHADGGKMYLFDVAFSTEATQAVWQVYGPDSMATMNSKAAPKQQQHLTFAFNNTGKPAKFTFQMFPQQATTVYRVDIYEK